MLMSCIFLVKEDELIVIKNNISGNHLFDMLVYDQSKWSHYRLSQFESAINVKIQIISKLLKIIWFAGTYLIEFLNFNC